MPREKGRVLVAQNRKARHDYHLGERFEAGLVLTGTEVKSLRLGRASLADAFATVDDQLVNQSRRSTNPSAWSTVIPCDSANGRRSQTGQQGGERPPPSSRRSTAR